MHTGQTKGVWRLAKRFETITENSLQEREKQFELKKMLQDIAANSKPWDYDFMCPVCLESDLYKNEDGSSKDYCFVMTPCHHKVCINCYEVLRSESTHLRYGK